MKIFAWITGVFLSIMLLLTMANVIGLTTFRVWAPQWAEARREVFEETQSFVHGKITHLNRLRLEYESTESDSRRAALRIMILQEAVVLERDNLPRSLQTFLINLEVK